MIGICDSGLGGLLLIEGIHQKYPSLDIVYYGDQAHMPYGNKTNNQINTYFKEIYTYFKNLNVTDIVVACNSMCSVIDFKEYELNIHDIIFKTVSNINIDKDKKILVFSTALTKRNGRYIKELNNLGYLNVENIALPELVNYIEGYHEIEVIKDYLYNIFKDINKDNLGAIILGCTHYPIVKKLFYDYYKVPIFDSNHLDFKLNDIKEEGRVIIHMPESEKLDRFMQENVKINYEYDKGSISFR